MRVVLFGLVIAVTALLSCAPQRAVRQATGQPVPAGDVAGLPDDQERSSEPESVFSRRIDRANLEEYAKIVAEGTWWREAAWLTNLDDICIRDIQIIRKETLEQTVVPAKTVHLVVAHVEASWWKHDIDIVMVFEPLSQICHIKQGGSRQERQETRAESGYRAIAAYVTGGPQWVKAEEPICR